MLSPYRALDLTDNRAALGPLILRDLGVDVIKVEPPGGLRARREPPFDPGSPDAMASLPFHAFNRGKRSIELDLDSDAGRERFLALLPSADFLFENAAPGEMAARGLGFEQLRQVNPALIHVAVTPFGQTGPYAGHANTDLTLAAMSGMAAVNGEADRPPVRMSIPQTWYHAAAASAAGAMAAFQRRLRMGEGQFVDVSVQASAIWTTIQAMTAHAVQGENIQRAGTLLQLGHVDFPLVFDAADGEVVLVPTGATITPMVHWLIEDGIVPQSWLTDEDWPTYDLRFLSAQPLNIPLDDTLAALAAYARRHSKQELLERGLAENVTIVPVAKVDEVLAFRHMEERRYWREHRLRDGLTVKIPGPFVRFARTPLRDPGATPSPGEHTAAVEAESRPPVSVSPAGGGLPFEGLKIADFSWIGVGPLTAKFFADHGATVVRVENTNPPDRLRNVGPFKDGEMGVDNSQFFAMANSSKKGIVLDLKQPAGVGVAKKLLEWCDVAFESFTPGTMKDLGLDYEVARQLNPGIIMVSTCLMGQTGPAARLAGYGYHAAAISGFYEVTGWDDRPPAGPFTAYTDIIAPSFLAASVAAALEHRRQTGEGQYIEQSQMESALYFLSEQLLDHQVNGAVPRRCGNDDPNMAPHGIYRCAGDDRWVAIACETDAQWEALKSKIGDPAWAADQALDGLQGRLVRRIEIDERLSEWTAGRSPEEAMEQLQAAGVPAGVVQRSSELLADPQLAHRRFFRPLVHSTMGEIPYEGHQYVIAGYESGPRFAAPCLGEHTFEILTEILEIPEAEAAELLGSGAVGV
ncbi:MAG: CaiB/BaiF CoA transferase family protein [Dehalococcoidia bacterium]